MHTLKHVCPADLTRRSFVKVVGATLGTGGFLGLTACGPAAESNNAHNTSTGDNNAQSSSAETLGDGKTLRVGMEAAYAPYNWQVSSASDNTIPIQNISGAYADGYDVQIAKRIAHDLGLEPVAVAMSFSGLVEALRSGQIDIICAGMSTTPERAESVDFSDSYLDDNIVLITKKDSPYAAATTLADFSGASVLGQQDTMFDDVIEQIPGVNHLTPLSSVPNVVDRLNNNACDAITFSQMSAPRLIETYPDLSIVQLVAGFQDAKMPANAAIAKGQEAVLAKINETIQSISESERQSLWDSCTDRQPQ